jgi:hypothetical protein
VPCDPEPWAQADQKALCLLLCASAFCSVPQLHRSQRPSCTVWQELQQFPWDVQEMHIIVRLAKRCDAGRVLQQYNGRLDLKDWVKLSEWTRYEPQAKCSQDAKGRGRYVITVPLERKSGYYVFNVREPGSAA